MTVPNSLLTVCMLPQFEAVVNFAAWQIVMRSDLCRFVEENRKFLANWRAVQICTARVDAPSLVAALLVFWAGRPQPPNDANHTKRAADDDRVRRTKSEERSSMPAFRRTSSAKSSGVELHPALHGIQSGDHAKPLRRKDGQPSGATSMSNTVLLATDDHGLSWIPRRAPCPSPDT